MPSAPRCRLPSPSLRRPQEFPFLDPANLSAQSADSAAAQPAARSAKANSAGGNAVPTLTKRAAAKPAVAPAARSAGAPAASPDAAGAPAGDGGAPQPAPPPAGPSADLAGGGLGDCCTGARSPCAWRDEAPLPAWHFIASPDRRSLAFLGFVRPNVGAIPPMAELQAMWWLRLVQRKLAREPTAPAQSQHYMLLGRKLPYGVDYGTYMHVLAEDIGSAPRAFAPTWLALRPKVLIAWALGQAYPTFFRCVRAAAAAACHPASLRLPSLRPSSRSPARLPRAACCPTSVAGFPARSPARSSGPSRAPSCGARSRGEGSAQTSCSA